MSAAPEALASPNRWHALYTGHDLRLLFTAGLRFIRVASKSSVSGQGVAVRLHRHPSQDWQERRVLNLY
jgi:hypothetical protein